MASKNLRTVTNTIYVLQALSFFTLVTAFAAIVLNYVNRSRVAGTIYESHFRWQMQTFWKGATFVVLGFMTAWFGAFQGGIGLMVGSFVIAIDVLWVAYRILVGWAVLAQDQGIFTA